MKILYLLYPLFYFINIPSIYGFIYKPHSVFLTPHTHHIPHTPHKQPNNKCLILKSQLDPESKPDPQPPSETGNIIIKKLNSVLKLTRSINILPTLLLSFSGGFIVEPSLHNLLHSSEFISTSVISLLIMSLSMVLNDIYDMRVDKINNPTRPLITGEISENEAYSLCFILLFSVGYLSTAYLSDELQKITNTALYGITIYTPVLKNITFIKNIFCAVTVSFAMLYSGIAMHPDLYQWMQDATTTRIDNSHYDILLIAMRYIFLGSLNTELLLDICDMEGDKLNDVKTLPVLLGKNLTFVFINGVLTYNIYNLLLLVKIYNNGFIVGAPILLFIPMIIDMYKIKKSKYDKKIIDKTLKNTTIPMFLTLLYMCALSYNI